MKFHVLLMKRWKCHVLCRQLCTNHRVLFVVMQNWGFVFPDQIKWLKHHHMNKMQLWSDKTESMVEKWNPYNKQSLSHPSVPVNTLYVLEYELRGQAFILSSLLKTIVHCTLQKFPNRIPKALTDTWILCSAFLRQIWMWEEWDLQNGFEISLLLSIFVSSSESP